MHRQSLAKSAVLALCLYCFSVGVSSSQTKNASNRPATGTSFPGCHVFDEVMLAFMDRHSVPGASLAVSFKGRLVHARGYGYADQESKEEVLPTSLFRIASLSKPITATAVLKLVEEGQLSLSDNPYEILAELKPPNGRSDAKFVKDVTILDLLRHSGGQGVRGGGSFENPMQPPASRKICLDLGVDHPPSLEQIICFMRAQEFEFEPGTKYAYSNYGYALLGRVIEKVSGKSYQQYVNEAVLQPLGINDMRIGRTKKNFRVFSEVVYYDPPGSRLYQSVFDGEPKGPWPYSGWHHEGWGAAGAWLGSAVGMVKFVNEFDPQGNFKVLDKQSIGQMLASQELSKNSNGSMWYALGWNVQQETKGRFNIWHTGSDRVGALSYLVRMENGIAWSAHFNCRFKDGSGYEDFNRSMQGAKRSIKHWPNEDLFAKYLQTESQFPTTEQAGAGEPATRPESKSEGGEKPQPEAEGRSR